ncbi:MAG: DUF255 domain-containing protein [Armatimonadia bacterium]|nr:DUF255 domain-containing protein [Armatimonadia bacterium]
MTHNTESANHLAGEHSLYLQQHAYNPVAWHPWGPEALERARAEDKPIFLSIGYSSCHWCHVMERESFEDEEVARLLNAELIPIKVDREERPDLDAVYMDAVVGLTGSGGWPMSVWLTPELKPFYGGTYYPKDAFLELNRRLVDIYRNRRDEVEASARSVYEALSREPTVSTEASISADASASVADDVLRSLDREWGGSAGHMKFPTPSTWAFALHRYRKTGEQALADAVRLTLDQMGSGGIHDHVGGGFHRYTVERTWLIPHFEKMLYDNGQLASLYAEAATVFGDARYEEIARDTLEFMLRDMRDPETGAFYASYDADSGGVEGEFYVWKPGEIIEVAGEEDGPPLAALLGVTEEGNFEGASVLTRRSSPAQVARSMGRPEAEVEGLFERWVEPLRERRARREWPGLDKKVVTSWNGLAIEAFARGYRAFGEPRYLDAATRAADYLWEVHRRDAGHLYRVSNGGEPAEEGVLDDYAFLAAGLLELHEASGDAGHARRALELVDAMLDRFAHPEAGFYMVAEGQEAPMGRPVKPMDGAEPSGMSVALHCLVRAAALTGDDRYRDPADRALGGYASAMERMGPAMSHWADAADLHLGPFYEVVIAGAGGDGSDGLVRAYHDLMPHHAVLLECPADGAGDGLLDTFPPLSGKEAAKGQPRAYVCSRGACQNPTAEADEMTAQILQGWHK